MTRFTRLALVAAAAGGLALLGMAAPAAAQGWGYGPPGGGYGSPWAQTPGLDRHQWQQRQIVREGYATGRIDPREGWRIERAQEGLRRHEAMAKADGVVTPEERWRLREHARRVDGVIDQSLRAPGYGYGGGYGGYGGPVRSW